MKNLIESSDYYLQNFKETRDSEFSEKAQEGTLDITSLRMQRQAVLVRFTLQF